MNRLLGNYRTPIFQINSYSDIINLQDIKNNIRQTYFVLGMLYERSTYNRSTITNSNFSMQYLEKEVKKMQSEIEVISNQLNNMFDRMNKIDDKYDRKVDDLKTDLKNDISNINTALLNINTTLTEVKTTLNIMKDKTQTWKLMFLYPAITAILIFIADNFGTILNFFKR